MNVAVILTGGKGTRMCSDLPKQFIKVEGKEIFIHTLNRFLSCSSIDRCILVINSAFENEYKSLLISYDMFEKVELCYGGNTRQESSLSAVEYLMKTGISMDDIVVIHDGARPLVDERIILDNINKCKANDGVVSTIVPIVDTLVDRDYNVLDRDNIFCVQTPQTFRFDVIYQLHKLAKENNLVNVSDDVQLAKLYCKSVTYVNGSRKNIKVTTKEDLDILESFLRK